MLYFPYTDHLSNINYFFSSLSEGLDFYLKHENINMKILGDFNATLLNPCLTLFLENQNLKSLSKIWHVLNLQRAQLLISFSQTVDLYQKSQSFEVVSK